ncbi:MAG: hypothetical protein ACTSQ5_15370 [Promethearchaeota archaeon]
MTLGPFLIVFVMAIILIGSPLKIKTKSLLAFLSLFLALIFIIFLLIFPIDVPIINNSSNQQNILFYLQVIGPNFTSWIQCIVLVISIVIYFRFHQTLHQIHSKEFFIGFYLIFTGSIMGLFLSQNLLVISSFFILASISLEFLFYFDTIEKKISKLSIILIAIFSTILFLTNIITQNIFKSLDLDVLIQEIGSGSSFSQLIIFIGYLVGFGGLCLIIPLSNLSIKNYFMKSNPIHLYLMSSIFIPVLSLMILKVSLLFSFDYHSFAHILFIMGCIGLSYYSIQLIIEIFGLNRISNQSINKIIGFLSAVEFNIFLLLGSLLRLPIIDDPAVIQRSITIFFILSVFSKSILIEIIQPKIAEDSKIEWNFESLRGKFHHNLFFVIVMLFIPLFYAFPGFLGFEFFLDIFNSINFELLNSSVFYAEFWIIVLLIIYFECIIMILVSNLIIKVYFHKSNQDESKTQKKWNIKNISLVAPIILIICNIIAIILI